MKKIILSEYNAIPENYRGIWIVERWDLPDWAEIREKHIGKRTMMVNDNGTCLLVEGIGFEIVDDSTWKKPDEVRQEIGGLYLKFYSEQGCEPHYADCVIRWCDTLETVEVRTAGCGRRPRPLPLSICAGRAGPRSAASPPRRRTASAISSPPGRWSCPGRRPCFWRTCAGSCSSTRT